MKLRFYTKPHVALANRHSDFRQEQLTNTTVIRRMEESRMNYANHFSILVLEVHPFWN
jgi:hypothetical protein